PDQFGLRFRKFLQPAVIGPSAIADGRVRTDKDLNRLGSGSGSFTDGRFSNSYFLGSRTRDHAIVKRDLPEIVKVFALVLASPELLHDVVRIRSGVTREDGNQFMN